MEVSEWYPVPSQRTDTTQGSAPMADHCHQWCARHPPTHPEGATESVGAFSGPFALATGVAGTAGGSGKGPAVVAVLVRLVSRRRVSLVVVMRRLLLMGSQRELPDVSAERLEELALLLPCVGRFGIRGGCRALWTRASLEAARSLLNAVSRGVVGKTAEVGGRGECCRRDRPFARTVERTSARSESRRERSRLARAGTAWLPTKARAFDPDEMILSKLVCAEGWTASRNPEMVESHQSSQDIVSPMPAKADSRPVSTE